MFDVINLQRKVKLDSGVFRMFVAQISNQVKAVNGKTFSVAFVSDRRMTELNKLFRSKDATTDVLSFPYESDEFEVQSASFSLSSGEEQAEACTLNSGFLGDIVISVEQAQRQAAENGLTLEAEIKQLILHGVLHLCGYDHETDHGEMNARELELRDKLGI